ncbi:toll/interleukin-1 receptor domain-containing protein [Paenibacillus odorifer]|uniref:toll/interleukin-1 receptor domain-containing protein n=1 Tax=Paenibacillus odorifer TaxID=189426 RepID=UPI00096C21A1|nr:toll/interleukin-1 receptor domain-containing protein [Paenibacillus odorifer]OME19937.1 hypothetical protein BSK57_23500 [Paenibacillus odorifer]
MESEQKSAFISYSLDSLDHQQWVYDLYRDLRKRGVDATIDKLITQNRTVNLNSMMIQNIRDLDYTIIVLTEKYAQMADNLEGDVGFETIVSFEAIKQNPNKFIFIGRGQGESTKV